MPRVVLSHAASRLRYRKKRNAQLFAGSVPGVHALHAQNPETSSSEAAKVPRLAPSVKSSQGPLPAAGALRGARLGACNASRASRPGSLIASLWRNSTSPDSC